MRYNMKVRLYCETCNKEIGEVNKENISTQDLEDYTIMFSCECGLNSSVEVIL